MGLFGSPLICSISSPLTHVVCRLPFLSYLAGFKSVSANPFDPDTMTKTALEATASSSDKTQDCPPEDVMTEVERMCTSHEENMVPMACVPDHHGDGMKQTNSLLQYTNHHLPSIVEEGLFRRL